MKKRKAAFSLRILFTAALITAMLTSVALIVNASAESNDPTANVTANESETVENVLSIGGNKRAASRLYAQAKASSYNGNYRSELNSDSVALEIYDGFYANFVTTPGNSPFTVNLDPAVKVNGVNSGNVDDEGAIIIEIDRTDPNYINFEKSVSRGATAFGYDHPEVFWIRDYSYNYSSSVTVNTDGTFEININSVTITPSESYSGAYAQRDTVNNGIAAAVSSIQNSIQADDTRYIILKKIHDYICNHAVYDYQAAGQQVATEAHTAAPLFNGKGKFVCEGYSKSLKILCDRFGIPCALVSGTAGTNNEAHMWNYVQMDDGRWYGVDVTWDDSGTQPVYNYFLKGSNQMETDHTATPPAVNNKEVAIDYPSINPVDYDPNWNQGTTTTSADETTTTSADETTTTSANETTTTSADETTTTSANETTTTSADETTTTSANETTTTTAEPKRITVRLDDPNNGFVKSADLPETAKAKAGNDDVELNKIRIVVTKLNETEKKTLSEGIRRINTGFDPDNSILEAYDIKLVDSNGQTVTITEGKIRICLAFSGTQTKKYTNYVYSIYHQKSEGDVERIKSVNYNAQGVWFESDKFSPFGLVSVEKSNGEPSPGTGETILMTVVALILLALAAGAIAFVIIRNRASSDDDEAASSEAATPDTAAASEKNSEEASGAENTASETADAPEKTDEE